MLDTSNREFRQLFRILSRRAVLWTEMVVDETLVYSDDVESHLGFEPNEHPVVCQIGGNKPEWSSAATKLVEKYGYDRIDLNCECPSSRVTGKREFGAALMKKPTLAAEMVRAMKDASHKIPVSVKTRIGVDELDDLDFLVSLIEQFRPHCDNFVIHARKVYTNGLSPAQNRLVPPLNYARVYALCERFPDCDFWINGGIHSLQDAVNICCGKGRDSDRHEHCHTLPPCSACNAPYGSCIAPPERCYPNLRGCMMGRAAMDNPAMFADVDRFFYGETSNPCRNRRQVLTAYASYLEELYPRRCCDHDPRVTTKFPAPKGVVQFREYCPTCWSMYKQDGWEDDDNTTSTTSLEPMISSRVMDRALKPILGMFYGLKGTKTFRRECDRLARDKKVRNCGPGFALRKAMAVMPDELLDLEFVV